MGGHRGQHRSGRARPRRTRPAGPIDSARSRVVRPARCRGASPRPDHRPGAASAPCGDGAAPVLAPARGGAAGGHRGAGQMRIRCALAPPRPGHVARRTALRAHRTVVPAGSPRRQAPEAAGIHSGRGGPWYWRHRGTLALHRAASDHVIAVSHAIRERLVTDYGYGVDAVTVVHNGIDTNRFRPDRDARARARSRWRIPDGAFGVGTVSRLAPIKRLERLLAAFRLLLEGDPEHCYLVIVGDGPAEAALRSEAERSGIGARCVWAGGSASPWEDYPGFDCFAMTSEREGLPHTLLEAMSCECLPVAMLIQGLAEVLSDGSTGRLVDQDPAALGAALQEIRAYDPARRREIEMRARRHVLLHHEAHRQIEASCDVILGSGVGPAA